METTQTEGLALPPLWAREASVPEKHAKVELEWKEPRMERKRRRVHTTSLECPRIMNVTTTGTASRDNGSAGAATIRAFGSTKTHRFSRGSQPTVGGNTCH
jgi:hypothetical protein